MKYGIFKFFIVLKEKFFFKNKNMAVIMDKINKAGKRDILESKKSKLSGSTLCERQLEINDENTSYDDSVEEKHISKNGIVNNEKVNMHIVSRNSPQCFAVEEINVQEEFVTVEEDTLENNFEEEINAEEDIHEENTDIEYVIIAEKICTEEIIDNATFVEDIQVEKEIMEEAFIEKKDLVDKNLALEPVMSRKEKEALYNDNIDLMQVEVNSKYLVYLREIPEIDKYSKLHNRIVKEFPYIKLLCEIEINDEEYKLLCAYFRKKYLHIRRDIGKSVVDIMFSIALVQIGIRNYDGNFWKQVDDVLGIKVPLTNRTWIGGTLSDTLLAFGKPLYSNQEYVTNILMHCFVTQSFLIRMYDYLFQYYNLDLQRDMAGMNEADMDFLCASIKNPFGMRKQLLSNYCCAPLSLTYN